MLDPELDAHLEAALGLFEPRSVWRARLLTVLAFSRYFRGPIAERRRMLLEALETAQATGDSETLLLVGDAITLANFHVPDARGTLALAERVADAAREAGDADRLLHACGQRAACLAELGRGAEFRAESDTYVRGALRLRHPEHLWRAQLLGFTHAHLAGDLAAAERHARAGFRDGPPGIMTSLLFGVQLYTLARDFTWPRSEPLFVEITPFGERLLALAPTYDPWRVMFGRVALDRGDHGRARDMLQHFAFQNFESLLVDRNHSGVLVELAAVAVDLREAAVAPALIRALEPYDGLQAVASFPCFYWGSISAAIGQLWLLLGEFERACESFRRAVAQAEDFCSVPSRAWAEYGLARALEKLGPADSTTCSALRARALATARSSGMSKLQALIEADAKHR